MSDFNRLKTNYTLALVFGASWLLPLAFPQLSPAQPGQRFEPIPGGSKQGQAALHIMLVKLMALAHPQSLAEARALETNWLANHVDDQDYYLQVAGAYFSAMQFKETIRVVDQGLKKYPKSFDLHMFKARSWAAVGELELAQPELAACQSLRPQSADVHYQLAALLNSRDDYQGALKEVNIGLSIEDKAANHWVLKGEILRNLDRVPESVEALNRAVTIGRNSVFFDMCNARIILARQLQKLKRYHEALAQYRAAQELKRRPPYKMCVEIVPLLPRT